MFYPSNAFILKRFSHQAFLSNRELIGYDREGIAEVEGIDLTGGGLFTEDALDGEAVVVQLTCVAVAHLTAGGITVAALLPCKAVGLVVDKVVFAVRTEVQAVNDTLDKHGFVLVKRLCLRCCEDVGGKEHVESELTVQLLCRNHLVNKSAVAECLNLLKADKLHILVGQVFVIGKDFGAEPELLRFLPQLFAVAASALAAYQLWGFSVGMGNRQKSLFWSWCAAYFCLAAAPGNHIVFITLGLWHLLSHPVLHLPPVEEPEPIPEEIAESET